MRVQHLGNADHRVARPELREHQLLILLDLVQSQHPGHVGPLAEIGVDLDRHRSVEGAGVIGHKLAADLQRPPLVRILADLVVEAGEQILEAGLAQNAGDEFGALLRPIDHRLDAEHGRRLQRLRIETLGGVREAGAPLQHLVQHLHHRQRLLAEERRRGEHHRIAGIAAGADHGAEIVVERVLDRHHQFVDHRLRIDALGRASRESPASCWS